MRVDPDHVTSPDDPRVAAFTRLTDMDLRKGWEQEAGVFMAEGHLVIERCASIGMDFVAVLTSPRWLPRLESLLHDVSVDVYVAGEDVLHQVTGFAVHRGALAAIRRPALIDVGSVAARDGDMLVLEDLVDPTNVGLALRSAVVQGIDSVILSPGCADPLYRRAVKSSMGAVLRARWARSDDWSGTLDLISRTRTLVALTPGGTDCIDDAVQTRHGVALMLGSEGHGLCDAALDAAAYRCAIPMVMPGDSLNVAAATAVACYVRARARTMTS